MGSSASKVEEKETPTEEFHTPFTPGEHDARRLEYALLEQPVDKLVELTEEAENALKRITAPPSLKESKKSFVF